MASTPSEPMPRSGPGTSTKSTTKETSSNTTSKAITPDPEPIQIPSEPLSETFVTMPAVPTEEKTEAQKRMEKAQAILKKYNIEMSPTDWNLRPKVQCERVSKNIRMRVRYTCHNCQMSFGHERTCNSCQHRRCSHCARYPPRKERKKSIREPISQPITTEIISEGQENPADTQCTCHECQTEIQTGIEECPNCHHKICERCLRETLENIPTTSETGSSATIPAESKSEEDNHTETS